MNEQGNASIPAVQQYLKAAQSEGINYQPLLVQANINIDLLSKNKTISNKALEDLIVLLASASNDPCFGLNSSRYVDPSTYGVLGYISMNCSSLREIFAKIPIYEKIVGDMGVTETQHLGDNVLQSWHCSFTNPIAHRHETENVLASWHTYTKRFLFLDYVTQSVWLPHSAPEDPKVLAQYQTLFDCEVLFDQPVSGILISNEFLDRPIPQADENLLHTLLEHATLMMAEMDQHQLVSVQVKNLLRLMLKEQVPSSTLIAEKLGMSSRTLQRKLDDEGTHYKKLLNELRLELALHYIKNTKMSLDEIAYQLGYAEARSFYRAFKQWTGETAGSYRA